jgi:hypothetical protein
MFLGIIRLLMRLVTCWWHRDRVFVAMPLQPLLIVELSQISLTYVKGERSGADDHIRR